ncbi:uncharacterized protein LOC126381342 [Pectinophora gossypiella]|uniref:uncharacterized protein LOC126381342 n=1 Tax=Pectinophora gossypiella TaxID=13191 RepID=UPI00214EA94F|nr:uncharacterized protein LOC126381342 [Pectinophora gossypiella]
MVSTDTLDGNWPCRELAGRGARARVAVRMRGTTAAGRCDGGVCDDEERKKLAVLIAVMGESAYELLSALASPKSPSGLKYEAAVSLLQNHLQPKPSKWAERYPKLFDGGLGRFNGGRATLRVREGAVPVYCRARPLPYALRERVDAELDSMLSAGVIEPVDCSDWATPLVIVNKPNGAIRLCADYKAL